MEKAIRYASIRPVATPMQISLGFRTCRGVTTTREFRSSRGTLRHTNSLVDHMALIIAYTELGREREARAEATEMMRISSHYALPPADKLLYNFSGDIVA